MGWTPLPGSDLPYPTCCFSAGPRVTLIRRASEGDDFDLYKKRQRAEQEQLSVLLLPPSFQMEESTKGLLIPFPLHRRIPIDHMHRLLVIPLWLQTFMREIDKTKEFPQQHQFRINSHRRWLFYGRLEAIFLTFELCVFKVSGGGGFWRFFSTHLYDFPIEDLILGGGKFARHHFVHVCILFEENGHMDVVVRNNNAHHGKFP